MYFILYVVLIYFHYCVHEMHIPYPILNYTMQNQFLSDIFPSLSLFWGIEAFKCQFKVEWFPQRKLCKSRNDALIDSHGRTIYFSGC